MDRFNIRTASINDIHLMLDWAEAEGWNPGLNDAVPFHVADPTGFLMGYVEDEPAASMSVVRYSNHFAFVSFYIVKSIYRMHGYGLHLWEQGIKHLHGYNIGINGLSAQQSQYEKAGFGCGADI